MNRRLVLLAFIPSLLGIFIVILLSKSTDDGSKELTDTEERVRNTNQYNADLDAAVLAVRLGLILDYDELTKCENQMTEVCRGQDTDESDLTTDAERWHAVKDLAAGAQRIVQRFGFKRLQGDGEPGLKGVDSAAGAGPGTRTARPDDGGACFRRRRHSTVRFAGSWQ